MSHSKPLQWKGALNISVALVSDGFVRVPVQCVCMTGFGYHMNHREMQHSCTNLFAEGRNHCMVWQVGSEP
jgi:hypothetical protein